MPVEELKVNRAALTAALQPEGQAHICDTGQPEEDRVIYRYTKFYPNL